MQRICIVFLCEFLQTNTALKHKKLDAKKQKSQSRLYCVCWLTNSSSLGVCFLLSTMGHMNRYPACIINFCEDDGETMVARSSVRSEALKKICVCLHSTFCLQTSIILSHSAQCAQLRFWGSRQCIDNGTKVGRRYIPLAVFSRHSADWRVLCSNTWPILDLSENLPSLQGSTGHIQSVCTPFLLSHLSAL